jgi:hypothetical protein
MPNSVREVVRETLSISGYIGPIAVKGLYHSDNLIPICADAFIVPDEDGNKILRCFKTNIEEWSAEFKTSSSFHNEIPGPGPLAVVARHDRIALDCLYRVVELDS